MIISIWIKSEYIDSFDHFHISISYSDLVRAFARKIWEKNSKVQTKNASEVLIVNEINFRISSNFIRPIFLKS